MAPSRKPPPSHQPSLASYLLTPVDIASLAAFRVLFGALMTWAMLRFFLYGWIHTLYVTPKYFFHFYGWSWVTPLPSPWIYLVFGLCGLSACCVALGLCYRLSLLTFFLSFAYIELLDPTNYLNHYYLVTLLAGLMLLMPLGQAYSFDAWWASTRGKAPTTTVPRWMLWLLRFQLGCVYFFAGVAKLTPDWLFRAQPLRIWLGARTDFPLIGPLFAQTWVAYAASWSAALFDLGIAFFLAWRPTRPWAYLVVIGFHIMTWLMFPIGIFPWMMICLTLIFFPPDWPKRLWAAVRHQKPQDTPDERAPQEAPTVTSAHQWLFVFLGLYMAIQVLYPLRCHLYPGQDNWREQAFRFSWKVMLIEKTGYVRFQVVDPVSQKRWELSPHRDLTQLQVKMMSTQPDMILQYAHHLTKEFKHKGYPKVQVFVRAYASLNGRSAQLLIDPKVDLARQHQGWQHKPWIMPLKR